MDRFPLTESSFQLSNKLWGALFTISVELTHRRYLIVCCFVKCFLLVNKALFHLC